MSSDVARHALIAIRDNIQIAKGFIAGLTFDDFKADLRSVYAVTRCLEIISEASRRLPEAVVARHPSIPWAQIRSAGNLYRHEYDNVSSSILWNTVHGSLDELESATSAEIEEIEKRRL